MVTFQRYLDDLKKWGINKLYRSVNFFKTKLAHAQNQKVPCT